MEHNSAPAYGLWSLAIINSLVFIIFAFSFAKPQSSPASGCLPRHGRCYMRRSAIAGLRPQGLTRAFGILNTRASF